MKGKKSRKRKKSRRKKERKKKKRKREKERRVQRFFVRVFLLLKKKKENSPELNHLLLPLSPSSSLFLFQSEVARKKEGENQKRGKKIDDFRSFDPSHSFNSFVKRWVRSPSLFFLLLFSLPPSLIHEYDK